MSNTFKLDDIRTKANENYGHFPVEFPEGDVVVLRNVLQLNEDERAQFTDEEDGEKLSTLERLRRQVRVTADDKEKAERLIDAIGENLAVFVQLIKDYNEATQAGEA